MTNNPKTIVIAGSLNMDIVVLLDKYPDNGETVFGKKISYIPGGKGANQARAITRLGGTVRFFGKVGEDQFGKVLIDSLKSDQIETKDIKISSKNSTGVAIIGVDKNAENRIIINSGSNFDLSPTNLAEIKFAPDQIAVSQFEIPKKTVKTFFTKAKAASAVTILNPSPIEKIQEDLLKLVDYLVINDHEFEYLSGIKYPLFNSRQIVESAAKIANKNQTIIITLGSQGCISVTGQRFLKVPGFKVRSIDTTGAGDSFLGAFSVALAEGKKLKEALTFANAAAAIKVTKFGASSIPYKKEVEIFMEKFK